MKKYRIASSILSHHIVSIVWSPVESLAILQDRSKLLVLLRKVLDACLKHAILVLRLQSLLAVGVDVICRDFSVISFQFVYQFLYLFQFCISFAVYQFSPKCR